MNTKTNTEKSAKIPVLVIFAPTASGKTALTRELFSPEGSHFIFKAEIISADSQAVYKQMDIGTAKPDSALQKEIPHHLIDLLNPDQQFNVSDFVDAADKKCEEIYSRGNLPVICGGTGFYIRNFLYGVAPTPVSDEKLRNQLKERIAKEGNAALYEELKKIDPESASKIHINDAYRICRALEVYYLSGKPRSAFKPQSRIQSGVQSGADESQKLRSRYDFLFIVLEPPRDILYERIGKRVEQMFEAGLKQEVLSLIKKGYGAETPGLKAIGYSEWFNENGEPLISNCNNIEESAENDEKCRQLIRHHSCKYAKKQYTYIRDIPGSIRIPYTATNGQIQQIAELIRSKFYAYLSG